MIADRAQKVIQDGARNFLDAVLRSPIKTSITAENMVAGQLIEIKRVHNSPADALSAKIEYIQLYSDSRHTLSLS